ncbi:MAG: two-component regulator propeller domain-containing protein [Bacteroidales bacterium]
MRVHLLTLVLLLVSFTLRGSSSDYFYFKQISLENGLTQSTVQSVVKDHQGYIWLGTKSGLNRYDQQELKTFMHHPGDSGSLPGNRITFITEDERQNLWISTNQGLALYNRSKDAFETLYIDGDKVFAGDFHFQKEGILFCGKEGLFFYDYASRIIRQLPVRIEKNPSVFFNSIHPLDEGRMLIGSRWFGLWYYYPEEQTMKPVDFYTDRNIIALFVDSQKQIWISPYGNGVFCYDAGGNLIKTYDTSNSGLSNDIILDIEEKDGEIWFATDGGGISILDPKSESFSVIEPIPGDIYSFPVNAISKLYKDPQNNMWAGTIRGGLIGIKKVFVKTYKDVALNSPYGLSEKTILSVCEDNKHIWIGTDGGGINRFDPATETFLHYPSTYKEKVASIINYSKTELMVSFFSKGVFLFNKETGKTTPFLLLSETDNKRICRSSNSVNMARISDDRFLFLADNVYTYHPKEQRFRIAKLKARRYISTSSLQNICLIEGQSYLFGQRNLFVLNHDGNTISPIATFTREQGIINAVTYDNGIFWVGTSGGLYSFHPKTGISAKINTNLFHEVSALIRDFNNRIWIAARGMLFAYHPLENRFSILDESEGVYPNEFLNKPVLCSEAGDVYMGGVMGLARIKEIPLHAVTESPVVNLTDVILNGNSMYEKIAPEEPVIRIPWNYSTLIVKSMAPDEDIFRNKIFRYEVSGLAAAPSESYDNSLKLHSLSPGKYDIRVACNTADGNWSEPKQILSIIISPPWWKSRWILLFLFSCIFALMILIAFAIVRRKEIRMKWRMKEHEQKIYEEKVRFLINISHELRTPLTLIYAPLKRMLDEKTLPSDMEKPISGIYKQAKRMRNIINMVLDLRKMEVADEPLQLHTRKLNEWITQVAQDFTYEFEEKNINIDFRLDDKIDRLTFDSNRCETVLSNLLVNALKFSDPQTAVMISSSIEGDYIRIAVKDEGIGLKNTDIEKLFTRFYQGKNHDRAGSGIGLSYAKNLIEMHQGKIGAYNNESGPGATFFFDLPIALAPELHSNDKKAILNDAFEKEADLQKSDREEISMNNTILIVEDEVELRNFIRESLCDKFKAIYEADNGEAALHLIKQELPDVIISDIMMPGMNGLQLCKAVKENPDICHIPFVLLTAKTDSESMLTSYKTGADIYISKPFDMDILETRVINLAKNKNSMKARYKRYGAHAKLENIEIKNTDEQFIIRLNDIINRNIANSDLDVKFITDEIGMSRATLYNKLKQLTDTSVNDYINKLRIAKAGALLKQSDLPIQEIAGLCGYSNQRYFSTAFKQHTGLSPSKYREREVV